MKYRRLLFCLVALLFLGGLTSCNTSQKGKKEPMAVAEQPNYRLYPTQNMWNFIKLNTVNGQMWIVQYTVNDDNNRYEVALNKSSLLDQNQQPIVGRYSLVPTQNMWNFILLDQVDGRQWQVQWGFDKQDNMIVPIK